MTQRARKRFGQHFLHDPAVVARIVDALDPRPEDRLVEIGPGRGVLTFPVLERAGRLDVIEVDRDLVALLEDRGGLAPHDAPPPEGNAKLPPHRIFSPAGGGRYGLVVHNADALSFDFRRLTGRSGKLRVFGNLPYNISTPLLFRLIEQADVIDDMLFMLQREVVDRITAAPGSRRYGRLTIMLAAAASSEKLFTVGPGAFVPAPRVDSAVVRILPRSEPLLDTGDARLFAQLVAQAFSHRRKTLRNALAPLATAEQITAAGLDTRQRPETVDPKGYADLSRLLARQRGASRLE